MKNVCGKIIDPFFYSSSPIEITGISSLLQGEAEFTKDDYNRIIKRKRAEYVKLKFGSALNQIFATLREEAERMTACNVEFTINIPQGGDAKKISQILSCYFSDLGYNPLVRFEKDSQNEFLIFNLT